MSAVAASSAVKPRDSGRTVQISLAVALGFGVLIAFPAPAGIGVAEVVISLLALATLLHFVLVRAPQVRLSADARLVGWALVAHVAIWMVAGLVGVLQGVELMTVVRSLLPQILLAPVALVGLSLKDDADVRRLGRGLLWIGGLHALYLLGLGVFAYSAAGSTTDLAVSRITLLDPRTTMPLFLACPAFGLALLAEGRLRGRAVGLALVGLGTIGALATQTRAQLLAIAVAILFFGLLFLIRRPTRAAIATAVALCLVGALTVATVPPLRNLAMVVVERQRELGDNARLEDEWLPALQLWERRGPLASLVGIGLGEPIRTFSGDEKTYIHNQAIYNVVYTGYLGLVMVYGVYFTSLFVFLRRFWRDRSVYDLGAAACLVAIMIYALFFAVHKLLSFNLMLFTLVAMAMRQSGMAPLPPTEESAS